MFLARKGPHVIAPHAFFLGGVRSVPGGLWVSDF
jgi:hypothetical protein